MFGQPGSLAANSTAKRGDMMTSDPKIIVGPAEYNVTTGNIRKRKETVAPFDTSSIRKYKNEDNPGPAAYFPRGEKFNGGSAIMRPDTFPDELRLGARTPGPGPAYKPLDGLTKLTLDAKMMDEKRPRVAFEKFVSNGIPTIYHPADIRCFVEGSDGRMYPWWNKRDSSGPGPKYNTFGIQTSRTQSTPIVNFSNAGERPSLFRIEAGFGPADFTIPRELNTQGGIMLGQTSDPKRSGLRYFDTITRQSMRTHYPTPFSHNIPSGFDKFSSKAVSAPFKSRTERGLAMKPRKGPGPADHFKKQIPLEQVFSDPNSTGLCLRMPELPNIKAFNTTEPRFFNPAVNELEYRPSPNAYKIPGFADELKVSLKRHRSAFRNPKLGFLVSSDARPPWKEFVLPEGSKSSPRRPWKNTRPRNRATVPYHGPPQKYPNSPGPIYDSNPGFISAKAKKTWNDPRRWICNTAFFVSSVRPSFAKRL